MAKDTRAVTVGTTATRLDTAVETDNNYAQTGQAILVYNNGSVTVWLGESDVTTAIGVPVPAGSWGPSYELDAGDTLYGITASSTADVRVTETGV